MSANVPKLLADPTIVAFRVAADEWPRTLLAETPIPDAWMALLERLDGTRRFVPAGDLPRGQRGDTLTLVRNRLLTIPLPPLRLPSASRDVVDVRGELLARWNAREQDLADLRHTLLDSDTLTLDRLARLAGERGLANAVRRFVRERPADALLRDDHRAALLTTVQEESRRFLFESGLTLDSVNVLSFSSESVAQRQQLAQQTSQRVEHIRARQMVEQAAIAAAQRRLEDMGGLLTKLRAAADQNSGGQWRELLPALAPAERGRLLESLWRITPDRRVCSAVAVVTPSECAWLDPRRPQEILRKLELPRQLGGLRSLSFDERREALLIGAAAGVWIVSAITGEALAALRIPVSATAATGVNSAVAVGDAVFATHSQFGCWRWMLGDAQPAAGTGAGRDPLSDPSDEPHPIYVPSRDVRAVRSVRVIDDNRILFSVDDALHMCATDGRLLRRFDLAGSPIHAAVASGDDVFVGTEKGLLLRESLAAPLEAWEVLYRGHQPVESITLRRWSDLIELAVPAGEQGVVGVFAGEDLVTRLATAAWPVRRAWACDDAIVALSTARDRLMVLHADQPERRGTDISIARMLGAAAQDVCLVTRDANA
ncbi:hypothetical protein RAS1_31490 [Phycisphaerae bacterium RAS1]|nr:hypothetical protein RAS1_31490 [Phycisphaerae bacterium RAS1]